jgi:hypothetical protein
MKHNLKLTAFTVASFACVACAAQISTTPNIISNCGGTGADAGYKMEWTVAEFAVRSLGNSQYRLTQGFHQPFLVKPFVSAVSVAEIPHGAVTSLWPNPASDHLNLSFTGLTSPASVIKLFGLDGKLVRSHPLDRGTTTTIIPIDDLAAGSYVAVIHDARSTAIASHRFIKTL